MNPLIEKSNTPFDTAPFASIKNEHYIPAIQEGIRLAKAEIQAIKDNPESPSFTNTIEALERSGSKLEQISLLFFSLNLADTNEEMQQIAQQVSPLLTEYTNDVILDADLFARIKAVYEKKDSFKLNKEESMLLNKTYRRFVRNGANLNEEDKEMLREIDKQLSKHKLQFTQNVLAETNAFHLVIDDKKDLEGLPNFVIEAAAMAAEERELKERWLFTLQLPSYLPFMRYAKNRSLRKKMAFAFTSKGFQDNDNDNQRIVRQIVELRLERANLLGYQRHSDFVLEERMAGSTERVFEFMEDLRQKSFQFAQEELQEVANYARKLDGLEELQIWDYPYYFEKLRKERYAIEDQVLKPYFRLENVVQGSFQIAQKLFGLQFREDKDIPVYHEEVQAYQVLDAAGNHKAVFYTDFFPRESKKSGAWMTPLRHQKNENGENQRPHVGIVCNFTKPTSSTPALLTFQEVLTLFHEFGHALHGMLANTKYASLSGTNVPWDFVELPSQLMENWCYEKEALDLFAHHYENGEAIPQELIQRIKDSANFMGAYNMIRQLSFAKLDMAWHGQVLENVEEIDLDRFEREAMADTTLLSKIEGTNMSASFNHIFGGGYSAGYYSYKWSEVLDADTFELFQEKGIFDKETAQAYHDHILSKGNSEEPMELYKRFRGKEPSVEALLRRTGLLKEEETQH